MNRPELNKFIAEEKMRGSDEIAYFELEKYRRTSMPFATFILTLIGVSMASRKTRGGIGLHIGLGMLISFSYILFLQVSSTFATNGNLSPLVAVWIPNLLYFVIALVLLRLAPK
jgi:lipopolysaccharide export system permease protein